MPLSKLDQSVLSFPRRVDARIKLISLVFAVIICVSTPPDRFIAFGGYFAYLLLLAIVVRPSARTLLGPVFVVLPFVMLCAVFIPFLHQDASGGGYNLGIGRLSVSRSGLLLFWNVLVKALFGVCSMVLFVDSTPFPDVLRALDGLRFPRLTVMLAGFVHRYAFVIAEEALRMKRAMDSRGYRGRWLWQAAVVGRMIGTLFLRSYERGERVYLAMLARGFDGRMPFSGQASVRAIDYGFLLTVAVVFLGLRVAAP